MLDEQIPCNSSNDLQIPWQQQAEGLVDTLGKSVDTLDL